MPVTYQFLLGNVQQNLLGGILSWQKEVSIPHRQRITFLKKQKEQKKEGEYQFLIGNVQQQHLSTVFFIILPTFPKINYFSIQKYIDLFCSRIATARTVAEFTSIFLFPENLVQKSPTYSTNILRI